MPLPRPREVSTEIVLLNPSITMKIYTHVNMESKREAMDAMQAAYMLAG